MQNEKVLNDILDSEWQDVFENMKIQEENPYEKGLFQYRDNEIFNQTINDKPTQIPNLTQNVLNQRSSNSIEQQILTENSSYDSITKTTKKQHSRANASKVPKENKSEKQQLYSKVYRQKMKEKYKILQDQNNYLKKRINQLQNQIRQQELELSRIKYSPPEKELNIDLRKQFIKESDQWLEQFKTKPPEYYQNQYYKGTQFKSYLSNFWAQNGFAGKKKLTILNYHFNEILESVLKDSEKYLSLVYANSISYDKLSPLPGFQAINNAHMEVYKPQGDLWHKLKFFNGFLLPMSLQLNKNISQFYKKYQDILSCCNKVHEFLRINYPSNLIIGKRRLQMERWFQFYKYGKLVRKLRFQWFNWMKSLAQKDEQQEKYSKKGTKKKKKSL